MGGSFTAVQAQAAVAAQLVFIKAIVALTAEMRIPAAVIGAGEIMLAAVARLIAAGLAAVADEAVFLDAVSAVITIVLGPIGAVYADLVVAVIFLAQSMTVVIAAGLALIHAVGAQLALVKAFVAVDAGVLEYPFLIIEADVMLAAV